MPNISLTLPDISQSVTRPALFDIIAQVQDLTGIDKATKIFFPGDIQKMQTAGSDLDAKGDRLAIFNTDHYTFIDVEEDYDQSSIGTTAVTQAEHLPVFQDPKLKVLLSPVYATTQITINFKYASPSKAEALRWRDTIRMRVSQMRDINLHKITYHYQLPLVALEILQEIYAKREAVLGYEETVEEYITAHCTPRLTLIGDIVGKEAILAISETQSRIIGMYGFDAIPDKPERDDGKGIWMVSFSYKFSYEKPIAVHMKYPVMVHNQLINPEFTTFVDQQYDLDKVNKTFSASLYALNAFESDTTMNTLRTAKPIIRIPIFDDYPIEQFQNATGTVLIALTEVADDKRTLLNLKELGDIVLDADILQFVQESEYPFIGKFYESILSLSYYRDEFLGSTGSLICSSNGDVKAKADLNLRKQNRVRLSIVTDLTLLTPQALSRLLLYPKALVKIISAINEILRSHPDFVNYGRKDKLTLAEFDPIYQMLTGFPMRNPNSHYNPIGNNWPYSNNPNGSSSSNGAVNGVHTSKVSSTGGPLAHNANSPFAHIDPRIVENYRKNRIGTNYVEITGIVSLLQTR